MYTMSKNYDALYDHLCAGGEALGKGVVLAPLQRDPDTVPVLLSRISTGDWSMSHEYGWKMYGPKHRDSFISDCQAIYLQWLSPVDLSGVIGAGDAIIELWKEELRYDGYDTSTGFREATYTWTAATAKHRKP